MTAVRMQAIFFLVATMACVAHSANCPPPNKVSPCSCHDEEEENVDVVLYCDGADTTLEQVKSALNAFIDQSNLGVELDGLNLGTVPSNFFQGFKVKSLHISHCNLDSLAGGGGKLLEGLEDTLEELVISSSFSEENEPAKLVVSHLKNLRELDVTFNTITELGNDWFQGAPSSLRRITFSNNGIEEIGDRAFADVTNLEYLSLDGNRFGPISRSMIPNPANELDTLELDNNALTDLPDDMFTNMPYLTQVSLATNGLRRLPEKVWKPVWTEMADIDLRGNPLECDSHMNWMSNAPTCADISASCGSPRGKVGEKIPFVRDTSCV